MKQSAVRTLGVAALSAAFAATGAGAANAATPAAPDALGKVTGALDTENLAGELSAVQGAEGVLGAPQQGAERIMQAPGQVTEGVSAADPVGQLQDGLTQGIAQQAGAAQQGGAPSLLPTGGSDPVQGLLGGLPVGSLLGG